MTQIADIQSNDIMEIRIRGKRGEIRQWSVLLDNTTGEYNNMFRTGDIATIYLGWGGTLDNVLKGLCFNVTEFEGEIELRGYCYKDFLVGPNITKEYADVDWGFILRDLISSYTILDATNIPDIGVTTGGRTRYISRALFEVINEILDEIGYDIEVDGDRVVSIYERTGDPLYGIRSTDIDRIKIGKTKSQLVNRIVIVADVEKLIDSFDITDIKDEYWKIISDEANWLVEEYNLKHQTSGSSGEIFSKISGYTLDITTAIKKDAAGDSVSIYYRRVNEGSFSDGYEVKMSDSSIELYKAGEGTPLDTYAWTFGTVWYKVQIVCGLLEHKIYLDNKEILTAEDDEFSTGKIAFKCPANKNTYVDYVKMITNTPVTAIAEDTTSIAKIGTKEIPLNRPEINTRDEAQRIAQWELDRRRFEASQLKLELEGTADAKEGDILRFYIHEPRLTPHRENGDLVIPDYLIIGVRHRWSEGEWMTKLELAEVVPELEMILAYLRTEVTRRLALTIALPKSKMLSDAMPALFSDTLKNIYKEYNNQIGGSRIGFTQKVSP